MKLVRFIAVFLVSFSLLLPTNIAFGKEKEPLAQMDKKLRKLGYPEELLLDMGEEQKRDILENKPVKFAGFTKSDYFFDENGELQEIIPGEISIMGTIPTSDLTLIASKVFLGTFNGRKTYRIYSNWKWKDWTVFFYTDKVGLSYNDKFQTRVSNNGNYTCQEYHRDVPGGTRTNSGTCGGRPADISTGGAAWYIDKHQGYDEGYAAMDIETKSRSNPAGTGIILTKYYHKTGMAGGIGLNIGYVSISASSGSGYDQAAAQSSWYY